MLDAIKLEHNVVIWPDYIESKDINDMIVTGISKDEIETIISSNSFCGLEAQTRFTLMRIIISFANAGVAKGMTSSGIMAFIGNFQE
jgi:hypothetical protein